PARVRPCRHGLAVAGSGQGGQPGARRRLPRRQADRLPLFLRVRASEGRTVAGRRRVSQRPDRHHAQRQLLTPPPLSTSYRDRPCPTSLSSPPSAPPSAPSAARSRTTPRPNWVRL